MPREDFGIVADLILQAVKSSSENDVTSPEGVEEFLDEAGIFDLEAKTEDRTDFSVAFWHPEAPVRGFNVRSRLSAMNPLLDGGRAANLKRLITSVNSLIREMPSKCIIRIISVSTRGKCKSIIRRLLRNTRSATSEYLSTPPKRSKGLFG